MLTAAGCRTFRTAFGTQCTALAERGAVFAFAAFGTETDTVGTVFPAVGAEVVRAVTAVIAFPAHFIGTVHTFSAVRTESINAATPTT